MRVKLFEIGQGTETFWRDCDLFEFARDNGLSREETAAIRSDVTDKGEHWMGGGAAPLVAIRPYVVYGTVKAMTEHLAHCIAEASALPDLNDAVRGLQDELGVTDGGIAGIVFSDVTPNQWKALAEQERGDRLEAYVKVEFAHMPDA
jgi:hypothetical protein